jgi:hypothetical protein
MTTLFETRDEAQAALDAAIAKGEMQGGQVYQDTLSAREKGLVRFVAEGHDVRHVWKL